MLTLVPTRQRGDVATMTLGEFISTWLADHGMTQRQLAARVRGLSQADISRAQTSRPTVEKLRLLAEAMEVPYNTLAVLAGFVDEQLPLQGSTVPHEQVIADLMAMAQHRPDLLQTIRELREENTDEVYQQALVIIWRHMLAGMETARDILAPNETATRRRP